MSWFKKEEGRSIPIRDPTLPELPESGESAVFPSERDSDSSLAPPNVQGNNLPPLPEDNSEIRSNQEEIKSAINNSPPLNSPPLNPPPQKMQRSRFDHMESPQGFTEQPQQVSSTPPENTSPETNFVRHSSKKNGPIYIRLDKFEKALETFDEVRNRITEVENLLIKTKELKEREGKELEEWERELHIIKSRIEAIDKDLFSKLD